MREQERLQKLRELAIMDSPDEKVFDEFTSMAAAICNTPVALISLLDGERQWFKSRVGIEEKATPRDVAFCHHAIQEPGEVMVVGNALADQRFAENPLVTSGPQIRFYAGAPLVTSDGHAIGTLCVIDQAPRDLTDVQLKALKSLAGEVIAMMEVRATGTKA